MTAALLLPPSLAQRADEDALLSWFAGLGIPIRERYLELGQFHYFQFSAQFAAGDSITTSHGRSEVRKLAALKCVGEFVERRFLDESYRSSDSPGLLPRTLRSSNGWAVHQDGGKAKNTAYREALERHLLLKSFLTYGWSGFRLVEKMETEKMDLFFLTSRFSADGLTAGMVIAKSPIYPGVTPIVAK